jgi:Tfp pilus assembly PilM family ATPase
MPEEPKKELPEPQKPAAAAPETNSVPTPAELAAMKAELDEEKKATAAAKTAITDRDKRITELQASVSVVQQAGETAMAELTQSKQAYTKAVAKYLDAVKLANPTLPGDVITGATIEEIDATVAKALSIATAVKATMEAQAKQAKVPAGAPPRGEISLEGLSPKEKIAAGIKKIKGGT